MRKALPGGEGASSRVLRPGLVIALGLALPALLRADVPTVAEVSATTVTLTSGSGIEWQAGMTGTLCGTETVGGEPIEVCPAIFEVTEVRDSGALATITDGDISAVQVGFVVRFEQKTALVVRSNVSGDKVTVNGRSYGATPQTIELSPDQDHLVAVEKPGYTSWQRKVRLSSGETREIWARLESTAPPPAQEILAEANRHYDAQDFPEALVFFERFIQHYPDHSDAVYASKLAEACRKKLPGNDDSDGPRNAAELATRAGRLNDIGDHEQAKKLAEQALELDPGNQEALDILGALEPKVASLPFLLRISVGTETNPKLHITDVEYKLVSWDNPSEVMASGVISRSPPGDWSSEATLEAPGPGLYRLVVSFRSGQMVKSNWLWDENHNKYQPAQNQLNETLEIRTAGESATLRITAKKNKMKGLFKKATAGAPPMLATTISLTEG